jgi:hypothetical protein
MHDSDGVDAGQWSCTQGPEGETRWDSWELTGVSVCVVNFPTSRVDEPLNPGKDSGTVLLCSLEEPWRTAISSPGPHNAHYRRLQPHSVAGAIRRTAYIRLEVRLEGQGAERTMRVFLGSSLRNHAGKEGRYVEINQASLRGPYVQSPRRSLTAEDRAAGRSLASVGDRV